MSAAAMLLAAFLAVVLLGSAMVAAFDAAAHYLARLEARP
jgi:hypothetical protein